ncbi:MAG: S8 family serine peptidase [Calditrichaeota bacterium]|nr:S8 family serine peptidase [Calditrichota bacterium]
MPWRRSASCLVTALILLFSFLASNLHAADKKAVLHPAHRWSYLPGEILVKFKSVPDNARLTIERNFQLPFAVKSIQPLFPHIQKKRLSKIDAPTELEKLFKLIVASDADIEILCRALQKSVTIEYAEPNYLFPVEAVPNDSLYSQLFHLPQIHAPEAWDVAKGDSSVVIAIIDTGVDWNHPDLAANIWRNKDEVEDGTDSDGNGFIDDIRGWDFVYGVANKVPAGEDGIRQDNNPMDFDGHGTFVAGMAAATTNNEIGVSSISWGCKIMPLRAGYHGLGNPGYGYIILELAAKAFVYAADNGADVINLSTASSQVLVDAARYAFDRGVVITKSAGNDFSDIPDPLELEPFVLTVAAVNENDEKASYSDFGDWIKICAPGGDYNGVGQELTSTFFNDTYAHEHGTSFAAPIVAGLAGLIKSYQPDLSAADIVFRIVETADNIDNLNPNYAGKLGNGRINAYRALTEQVQPHPELSFYSLRVDDSENGNNNGKLDPGETVKLYVKLQNRWGDGDNLNVHLDLDDHDVTLQKADVVYPHIPGLSDLNANSVENQADPFILSVDAASLPKNIPAMLTIVDQFGSSGQLNWSIPVSPSVLLVDDDNASDNAESFYKDILDSLHLACEIWDHNKNGAPVDVMDKYSTVIWFCAQTGADVPTLDAQDRQLIADFLDNGGNLFLSGQDIGWDLCEDVGSDGQVNEYKLSNGESKNFYENYFHAKYLKDDSGSKHLVGKADDPIGADLQFDVNEPGNGWEYPSEIAALDSASSIFAYIDGVSGAIRYAGNYRLVYFAFGGLEGIADAQVRQTLFARILNWLNGLHFGHTPLKDTENTTAGYPVSATVTSDVSPVKNVTLFWMRNDSLSFHKTQMSAGEENQYVAEIPAQMGVVVEYAIQVRLQNDFIAPIDFYHFYAGADTNRPVIENLFSPKPTFARNDLLFRAGVRDDEGVDTNSVFIHFSSSRLPGDSLQMQFDEGDQEFAAILPGPFYYGDTLFTFYSAADISARHNRVESSTDTLIIGFDDFENGLSAWDVISGAWGLDQMRKHSGLNSINDSPFSEINAGMTSIINLSLPLDFSGSNAASLSFWTFHSLREQKDLGYVEISSDSGATWQQIGETVTGTSAAWALTDIPLDQVLGEKNVLLRFRLVTDPQFTFTETGWSIDDVKITEDVSVHVAHDANGAMLPKDFRLRQNFPNPFNPATRISYDLAFGSQVSLKIYNSLGQLVKTLVDSHQSAGSYLMKWEGLDNAGSILPAGIYFVKLQAGDFSFVRKMALVK